MLARGKPRDCDGVESSGRYLAAVVDGANGGVVTTFAVVSGLVGTALDRSIVLGSGKSLRRQIRDGMSDYLGRRPDLEYQRSVRSKEPAPPSESSDGTSPRRTAFVTFLAFVIAGWALLMP